MPMKFSLDPALILTAYFSEATQNTYLDVLSGEDKFNVTVRGAAPGAFVEHLQRRVLMSGVMSGRVYTDVSPDGRRQVRQTLTAEKLDIKPI